MNIGRVTHIEKTYYNRDEVAKATGKQNKDIENPSSSFNETAVTYEKEDLAGGQKKVYQRDDATIQRLKEDLERREQSLRDLVRKMLLDQGQAYQESMDIYGLLREGKINVDPQTVEKAQRDIAEDGYWGVEQTSERLVSFAKALTGGDPSKADEMIEAVKKGFEQATKAWGAELPDISKKTLEATIRKLEDWRDQNN